MESISSATGRLGFPWVGRSRDIFRRPSIDSLTELYKTEPMEVLALLFIGLACAGYTGSVASSKGHDVGPWALGGFLLGPFALLALITLLPLAVDILFLNPCLFLLFLREGWNVLFISLSI
jgi:hypothetical protein